MSFEIPADTNFCRSLRIYKKLTKEYKTIHFDKTSIVDCNTIELSNYPETISLSSNQVQAKQAVGDKIPQYYLSPTDESYNDFGICFGSFEHSDTVILEDGRYTFSRHDIPLDPCIIGFDLEFIQNKPKAIDVWKRIAQNLEESCKDYVSSDHYGVLRARVSRESLLDYTLTEYLEDFPDMMTIEQIKDYLTKLYECGILYTNQNVVVPLTDRIYYDESKDNNGDSRITGNSYVYLAIFKFKNNGGAFYEYNGIIGADFSGTSISNNMQNYSTYLNGDELKPAFIFCQRKRSYIDIIDIPLKVSKSFNDSPSITIKITSKLPCYINFISGSVEFVPLLGNVLVPERSFDSYILPLSSREMLLNITPIKKDGVNTFLLSASSDIPRESLYSSDYFEKYEEEDSLDTDLVYHVYSSR